jgi:hypothetical protein
VHHVEIYLPCNFEVNLNTHLGVLALFSSIKKKIIILFVLFLILSSYISKTIRDRERLPGACIAHLGIITTSVNKT